VAHRSRVSATSFKDAIDFLCFNDDNGRYADALIATSSSED